LFHWIFCELKSGMYGPDAARDHKLTGMRIGLGVHLNLHAQALAATTPAVGAAVGVGVGVGAGVGVGLSDQCLPLESSGIMSRVYGVQTSGFVVRLLTMSHVPGGEGQGRGDTFISCFTLGIEIDLN